MSKDFLIGVGIGAVLAFVADPQTGPRRRKMIKDRLVRRRSSYDAVDDRRLVKRVRSQVERACSHPRAIGVEASSGTVTLRGPILADELGPVLGAVWGVPGLLAIRNEMTVARR